MLPYSSAFLEKGTAHSFAGLRFAPQLGRFYVPSPEITEKHHRFQ